MTTKSTTIPASGITSGRQVRPGLLLLVTGVCFLMVMMDNTILNVALRDIQNDLSATTSQLQWAVDSYILVYAALMFTAGVLADRYGRRRVLALGLLVFAVASALSAWAVTPEQLILWRAVMGVGGAVVPPATLAIIKDGIPEKDQGKAMGVWAALGGISVALGPIIGGTLLEGFWWGSVFLINLPVAAVCLVLLFVALPESRSSVKPALDVPGLILSAAAISALVYGVIEAGATSDWLAPRTGGLILLGLVLSAVLVAVERRKTSPALDITLFRSPAFAGGTLSISLAFFALTGGTFLLVFFAQLVLGHSPLELGLILLPVAFGSIISAINSAAMVRIAGFKASITGGLLLLTTALGSFVVIDADSSLILLEAGLLVAGLGMGLVMGATTTLAMSAVEVAKAGVGGAVNNTLRQVGAALGVAVMGSVLSMTYQNRLGGSLDWLPADLRERAQDSLGSTSYVLNQVATSEPKQLPAIEAALANAQAAFVDSMHLTFWICIGILLIGALAAAIWIPTRIQGTAEEAPA
ncbi:MFS transporter [Paenarthrobacter nicotinovorans]|uniref:MFS transporter n=1 Tax=Paenarthrobacter nicotinovorans TaxID=29320 RepID=UPI003A8086AE